MSAAIAESRAPVPDLDIEQWVHEHYGFVPHPFWIGHCKELFLREQRPAEARKPWHECPLDKRPIIREAFAHFHMLADLA